LGFVCFRGNNTGFRTVGEPACLPAAAADVCGPPVDLCPICQPGAGLGDALAPQRRDVPVALQLGLSPSYCSTNWQTSPASYWLPFVSVSAAVASPKLFVKTCALVRPK